MYILPDLKNAERKYWFWHFLWFCFCLKCEDLSGDDVPLMVYCLVSKMLSVGTASGISSDLVFAYWQEELSGAGVSQ